jgi:CHAD domain-containing protein
MRVNGSDTASATASLPARQSQLVFERMSGYIGRLSKNVKAADVHRFRTNSRRVEALVAELAPESGNQQKLLKLLAKSRKKAGRVRDLDVQIDFLKKLTIPDRQNHRAQLLEVLNEEQARRSRKLAKFFDKEKASQLRKRLRKAKSEISLDGVNPLKLAFNRLPKPGSMPVTEKLLHACRIAAKRARYLAELASDSPEAAAFITELKRAQDEIGQWHDVLKLTQRAEKMFGGVRDSALVSALQNVTHARFRRAASALQTALKNVAEIQQKYSSPSPARKAVAHLPAAVHTAAA